MLNGLSIRYVVFQAFTFARSVRSPGAGTMAVLIKRLHQLNNAVGQPIKYTYFWNKFNGKYGN